MRRLRLISRLVIGACVDPAVHPTGDRSARRRALAQAMATFDPAVFPLLLAMFTGPETIPAELAVDSAHAEPDVSVTSI